jgi:hypothetical protein
MRYAVILPFYSSKIKLHFCYKGLHRITWEDSLELLNASYLESVNFGWLFILVAKCCYNKVSQYATKQKENVIKEMRLCLLIVLHCTLA